jgi:hypothetical protein
MNINRVLDIVLIVLLLVALLLRVGQVVGWV